MTDGERLMAALLHPAYAGHVQRGSAASSVVPDHEPDGAAGMPPRPALKSCGCIHRRPFLAGESR